MSQELKACPLCEGGAFTELYVARDRHYGIAGSYRIVRCADCQLVFLNPMYSDDELGALYPSDYYAYQDNFSVSRLRQRARRALGYLVGTKEPRFEKPGTMLDLGCGSGWFLDRMRQLGWTTYGVEINKQAADLGRKSRGLEIFSGNLQQAKFPSGFFDYVRANQSFEHISCPSETLNEIHRILKPRGKLLLGVPNVAGANANVFKQYWWHLCAPVHAFNYSKDTLPRLLRKHAFVVERIRFNSDYFGILGSAQIWMNRNNGKKSMEGSIVNNYLLRFVCQCVANFLDFVGQGDLIEVTAIRHGV